MKTLVMAFALLSTVSFAKAGGVVENGGDTIYCRENGPSVPVDQLPKQPPPNWKLYSRDYIDTLSAGASADDFVMPIDWSQSQARLARIVGELSPKLAKSFGDFSAALDYMPKASSEPIQLGSRVWEAVQVDPFNRHYRLIWERKNIPANCAYLIRMGGMLFSFAAYERTVLRKRYPKLTVYSYLADSFSLLAENSALQHSMLLVHEWLWDHTRSARVNRRVNAFLHSREIDLMDAEQIRRKLKKLGLEF